MAGQEKALPDRVFDMVLKNWILLKTSKFEEVCYVVTVGQK